MRIRRRRLFKIVEIGSKVMLHVMVFAVILVFAIAFFKDDLPGQAYIGEFDTWTLNEDWTIKSQAYPDGAVIDLPQKMHFTADEKVELKNTLPLDIKDGMRIAIQGHSQEVIIYVDGQERSAFIASGFDFMPGNIYKSFVFADLMGSDAGKPITIELHPAISGEELIDQVEYSYGNDLWHHHITNNIALLIVAVALAVLAFISIAVFILLKQRSDVKTPLLYLAVSILVASLWIISESEIRQLLFKAPVYANFFGYIFAETLSGFISIFFNEIQEKRYQYLHIPIVAIICAQTLLNAFLNFAGIAPFQVTLQFSHVWTVIGIAIGAYTLFLEKKSGHIKEYPVIASSMVFVIMMGAVEIITSYTVKSLQMGVFLGLGLFNLLLATMFQLVKNEMDSMEERRIRSEHMTMRTIKTIAGTIDAKDQYTGGHSARVGYYAKQLLEAIAEDYGFDQSDVERIEYIGMMHDIGKVGVPDGILNKAGKLSDEEFEEMQSHTIIGAEILQNIDDVEGLAAGARNHHERWDGKGYPDGLKGEEIPVFVRILCIADCYDAMTSDRVYRSRLSPDRVYDELKRGRGTQFDPELVDRFLELIDNGTVRPEYMVPSKLYRR